LRPFDAFTFDCFGTLVDWRRGMREALLALPDARGAEARTEALIAARETAEQELQRGPFLPYQEILARSISSAWRTVLQSELPPVQARAFAASQGEWPAFPDSPAALQRLQAMAPLALLSNCDPGPLRDCAAGQLRIPDALLIDAARAGSYKPAPGHWRAALAALQLPPARILHVSAYDFYDLRPARALGFAVAFVARDGERPPADLELAFQARDLADLADQVGA
jgi:2-haloalkanoic acid dehalogenase type II